MPHKHFDKIKVEKLPDSEAQVTGEITLPFLVELRPEALKNLNKSVSIDGFRSGHIPEDVLIKKVGEMHVLEEVAELALARVYEDIMNEAKLSPVGRPEVAITKLAPGIPLEFRMKVYLEPEFDLPDYKKIAKEVIEKEPATDDKGKEKNRIKIIETLVKETKVSVPKIFIESELNKMIAQFQDDIARAGAKWEDYLKELKKTEEDLRNEWREKAIERVKAELIVIKIAEKEKIEPTKEEVEKEVAHVLSHHPDADNLRVHIFVYTLLRNQKVLEFIES